MSSDRPRDTIPSGVATYRIEPHREAADRDESYYVASSWTLIRRRFLKHRLAMIGSAILIAIYLLAAFAGFFSVADIFERYPEHRYAPPTRVRVLHEGRLQRRFVYGLKVGRHLETLAPIYEDDRQQIFPVRLLGLFPQPPAPDGRG